MKHCFLIIVYLTLIVNLSAQWQQTNGPFGGKVNTFATNESIIYAGTKNGIFQSTNNGVTWNLVNVNYVINNITAIACSGSNIFVGTNDGLLGTPGIYLSTDSGLSWSQRNNGLTELNINSILINETNIYVGTYNGLFLSTNNGNNWIEVDSGIPAAKNITSIIIKGSTIFVGTQGNGVYLSTNNGTNWYSTNTGLAQWWDLHGYFWNPQVNTLAIDGNYLLAGTFGGSGTLTGGVFTSTNNGNLWTKNNNGLSQNTTIYSYTVSNNYIYAGTDKGMWRSTDHGTTWSSINNGISGLTIYSTIISGSNLLIATDVGIFQSSDNGNHWTASNSGLNNTQVINLLNTNSGLFAGTSNSGLFSSSNSGTNWDSIDFGLSGFISVNSISSDGNNMVVGTSEKGVIAKLSNSGMWSQINNGLSPRYVSAVAIKDNTIYAGIYTDLYVSSDFGANWSISNTGLAHTEISSIVIDGTNIFAATSGGLYIYNNTENYWKSLLNKNILSLAVNGNSIYAGINGGVYYSSDAGSNWSNRSNSISDYNVYTVSQVSNKLVIGSDHGVYVSNNNGVDWVPLNSGLRNLWVYSIVSDGNNIFLGTKYGVLKKPISDVNYFVISTTSNPTPGGSTIGGGSYILGTSITVSATPSSGYSFVNWTENGIVISTNSTIIFAVNSNRTLVANFISTPVTPTATNATSITQSNFTASWDSVSTATKYYLDVAIDNNFGNMLSTYNNKDVGNTTSYSITNLNSGTTYYYRVRSYNAAGYSSNSNIISTTTLPATPTPPVALMATNKTQTGFTANWGMVSNATGYYIDLAVDIDFINKLSNFNNLDVLNVASFQVAGLISNIVYYYRVRAYNCGGVSSNSNVISIALTAGIELSGIPNTFALYQNFPNPFNPSTAIMFGLPKESKVIVSIYDILGHKIEQLFHDVMPRGYHTIYWNAKSYSSGTYFYILEALPINGGETFRNIRKLMLLK